MKDLHNLLVVDDEDLYRQLTMLRLRKEGCEISEAASGKEALELIEAVQFDIILLDFEMPEMNGLEVLSHIRLKYSPLQLPVIMVTGNGNDRDIVDAFHLGANDYLLKPLNFEVTEARIRTQLSQSYLANLKDSFMQFANHDLKKPLLIIRDICDDLKQTLNSDYVIKKDTLSLFDLILDTVSNTEQMLDGFLNDSQQQKNIVINNQLVDLHAVIENLYTINSNYFKRKRIDCKLNLTESEFELFTDLFRITQIIDNLIGNAIKFSPENTTVEIITQLNNGSLLIEVKDTGPGIPENDFQFLFTKHAKLSNKPTGNEYSSGIGLALCQELAKQINAEVGAYNNPDGGATFFIKIGISD